mgnify:CR=1 FL=1
MTEKKEVQLPQSAKEKAIALFNQTRVAQLQFQSFLDGCKEGLGLEGNWNLDTNTWTFILVEKKSTEGN